MVPVGTFVLATRACIVLDKVGVATAYMSATTTISLSIDRICTQLSRHGRQREHLGRVKMAARLTLSSPPPLTNQIPVISNPGSPSLLLPHKLCSSKTRRPSHFRVQANLGGGGGEMKPKGKGKRKFITREEEPEQYWQTAGEREGENPMKTPIPYIIIFGMSTPFVILAIAFANGWVKFPAR